MLKQITLKSTKAILLISLSLLFCILVVAADKTDSRPNFVVILVDDLGNADIGYRGSQIKTPHLDKLAEGGVRFESFYSLPLCTPARTALMTGRYPMRQGLQTFVIFPGHTYGLPTDEKTLPQALKEVGYETAMVGKWHLGHADKKYWPNNRGFDHFYGNLVGEVDFFTKERGGIIDWQRDGKFFQEEGYYTELIGDEAVNIIKEHDTKNPLFLYVASLAVHTPLQAPQEEIDVYNGIFENEDRRIYAAMMSVLDKQVGRIVDELEKKGMRENTLIFFASDNGGIRKMKVGAPGTKKAAESPASNGKFRDGKSSLYEGGVRVPAFVNWPSKIEPNVFNGILHQVDVMPTLLKLAGAEGNPDKPFDGKDMWPVLTQKATKIHDDILINVEFFRGAVRKDEWKLVKVATLPGKTELFNLEEDPYETTNLAEQYPEKVEELTALLVDYSKEQETSQWIKAQPNFLGVQGKTVLDPDFDISDGGLPQEKPVFPKE